MDHEKLPLPASAIITRILLGIWILMVVGFCFGVSELIIPIFLGFAIVLGLGVWDNG